MYKLNFEHYSSFSLYFFSHQIDSIELHGANPFIIKSNVSLVS